MTIVSVHLPKTAGTSFGLSLATYFGDRLKCDYGDQAISKSTVERWQQTVAAGLELAHSDLDNVECVHGHFLPAKYLPLEQKLELTFVTWMREPLARMFSHYRYWQQSYDERTAAPHHRRVIEECWSLERFCLSEEFRNIYTQYLWKFPLEKFSFVGISEHFQEDLEDFSSLYLSARLPYRYQNASQSTHSVELDDSFLEAVRKFHSADMELYAKALHIRRIRRGTSNETTLALAGG